MKVIVLLLLIGGFAFGLSQIFAPASTNAASNIESEKDMSHLTDMQKYVTQHDGTEPPFQNEYCISSCLKNQSRSVIKTPLYSAV